MNRSPPISAKVSRMRVAITFAAMRRAQLNYYAMRERYKGGQQPSASAIGFTTMTLWAAETVHREAVVRYQETLRMREKMPAGERWQIQDLQRWLNIACRNNPVLKGENP